MSPVLAPTCDIAGLEPGNGSVEWATTFSIGGSLFSLHFFLPMNLTPQNIQKLGQQSHEFHCGTNSP
jgi:hypothetical protein